MAAAVAFAAVSASARKGAHRLGKILAAAESGLRLTTRSYFKTSFLSP